MNTTRSPHGVPTGPGGGITPHNKAQLKMSSSPLVSWRDVSVYLMWHSSGRCTIMTAFERPDDHSYVVCTPHAARQKSQEAYRSTIKPKAQEMSLSSRWKKRIYSAYNNGGGEAVSEVLDDLEDRDVREVIIHE